MKSYTTALLLFLLLISPLVQADLLVSPTRIAFDNRERVKNLNVVNSGEITRAYRLSFIDQRAKEAGGYIKLTDDSFTSSAKDFLRVSPKQVVLKPGESQVIKVVARRPSNLANGEYRSHLFVEALANPMSIEDLEATDGISMHLNVQLSYSFPIIVRKGPANVDIGIDTITTNRLENGNGQIHLQLSKKSPISGYGKLKAYWTPVGSSTESQVGILNEYKFFHELNKSTPKITWLNMPKGRGKLRVAYLGGHEFAGRKLAEKSVFLEIN